MTILSPTLSFKVKFVLIGDIQSNIYQNEGLLILVIDVISIAYGKFDWGKINVVDNLVVGAEESHNYPQYQ